MRMDPQTHVRLFVPNEMEASSVLSFDSLASALTAMKNRTIIRVGVDGYGPMTPAEFVSHCNQQGIFARTQ